MLRKSRPNLLTFCFVSFSWYAVLFPSALSKLQRSPGTYLEEVVNTAVAVLRQEIKF